MVRSKAGASEYARWCREVGIQLKFRSKVRSLVVGAFDAFPLNASGQIQVKGVGKKRLS